MASVPTKLEAMMVHLLNERGPSGKPWSAITVPGFPRFSREDAMEELFKIRRSCNWWQFFQFWK